MNTYEDGLNTLYPGRPDYTGPNTGLFGLLHHDRLYEWSENVAERVAYVRANKPASEQEFRLHCMVYLDPTGQEWAESARLRAESTHPWAESTRLWVESARLRVEGARLRDESTRLRAESHRLLAESARPWAESSRLWTESTRLWDESTRLLAESARLWDESTRLRAEGARLLVAAAPAIEARIHELVPDLPWNGTTLLFPSNP